MNIYISKSIATQTKILKISYELQGNRLGNQIAKLVIEFIKSHINPDPAAASIPLSAQIQSTQGFNAGGPSFGPPASFGKPQRQREQQRNRGSQRNRKRPQSAPPQSFDQAPPTQSFASQSIAGSPVTGFGLHPQGAHAIREMPRRPPLAAAVPASPHPSGFVAGHHGKYPVTLIVYLYNLI